MKKTRQTMKKIVSIFLALAMVVTGTSYTPQTVSAAEDAYPYTYHQFNGLCKDNIGYCVTIKENTFGNSFSEPSVIDNASEAMLRYTFAADSNAVTVKVNDGEAITSNDIVNAATNLVDIYVNKLPANEDTKIEVLNGEDGIAGKAEIHVIRKTETEEPDTTPDGEVPTGNIAEGKSWTGWHVNSSEWHNISDSSDGYTLTGEHGNIGTEWWHIQTAISIEFRADTNYTCEFTLTAPKPKAFTVDENVTNAKLFTENEGGSWKDNGNGTYSYKYVGTYQSSNTESKDVRISLGYHSDKDGKTDSADYTKSTSYTFTVSGFKIMNSKEYVPEETVTDKETTSPDSGEKETEPEGAVWAPVNGSDTLLYYVADGKENHVVAGSPKIENDNVYIGFSDFGAPFTSVTLNGVSLSPESGAEVRIPITSLTKAYNELTIVAANGVDTITIYIKNTDLVETTTPDEGKESTSPDTDPDPEKPTVPEGAEWIAFPGSSTYSYYVSNEYEGAIGAGSEERTDELYINLVKGATPTFKSVTLNGTTVRAEGAGIFIPKSLMESDPEGTIYELKVVGFYDEEISIYLRRQKAYDYKPTGLTGKVDATQTAQIQWTASQDAVEAGATITYTVTVDGEEATVSGTTATFDMTSKAYGNYEIVLKTYKDGAEIDSQTYTMQYKDPEAIDSIYCGVTRMHLWRFNLHKTNAANEELVISLKNGRVVQERNRYTYCPIIIQLKQQDG